VNFDGSGTDLSGMGGTHAGNTQPVAPPEGVNMHETQ